MHNMKGEKNMVIVTIHYSFDNDAPVHIFDTEKEAKEFIKKDFEKELKIAMLDYSIPENISAYISDDNDFAQIRWNNDSNDIMEWSIGRVVEHQKKTFNIPVRWEVCDFVKVEAKTLEDAIRYVKDNMVDEGPWGGNPVYIDGTFSIYDGRDGECSVEETAKYLREHWNSDVIFNGEKENE